MSPFFLVHRNDGPFVFAQKNIKIVLLKIYSFFLVPKSAAEIKADNNKRCKAQLDAILSAKNNSNEGEAILTDRPTSIDETNAIVNALKQNIRNKIVVDSRSVQRFSVCGNQEFRLEPGRNKPTFEIQRNNCSGQTTVAVVRTVEGLQDLINGIPSEKQNELQYEYNSIINNKLIKSVCDKKKQVVNLSDVMQIIKEIRKQYD